LRLARRAEWADHVARVGLVSGDVRARLVVAGFAPGNAALVAHRPDLDAGEAEHNFEFGPWLVDVAGAAGAAGAAVVADGLAAVVAGWRRGAAILPTDGALVWVG